MATGLKSVVSPPSRYRSTVLSVKKTTNKESKSRIALFAMKMNETLYTCHADIMPHACAAAKTWKNVQSVKYKSKISSKSLNREFEILY